MHLPKIQDADLQEKVVLIRVDHNVVKKGKIKDPYRIDASIPTIEYVLENGGKPILMSHVGRPRDKKTKEITVSEETSVMPIVDYLKSEFKLNFKIAFDDQPDLNRNNYLDELQAGKIDGLYLPNTRWFPGEEAKNSAKEKFSRALSDLADIFVNDAFGSWQPHASTVGPTTFLPSYAGLLMQKEISNLERVLSPKRPFLAVVAGSKFDTKIEPLNALLKKVDHLIIGGVIYNAYLCAKYGIEINGISEEDVTAARKFLDLSKPFSNKIIELPFIVESKNLEDKIEGKYRIIPVKELKTKKKLDFVLDAAPESFQEKVVRSAFLKTETIFVNAVMGLTPQFSDGTIALNSLISENEQAAKFFGGGDTLQEFKTLLPDLYTQALKNEKYYFFTGGGTILKAIKEDSPYGLEPVKALLKDE